MWTKRNNITFLTLSLRVSFALLLACWLSECEAFSSFPAGHWDHDAGHPYDSEEFFFVDRTSRRDTVKGQVPSVNHHRQRFSVEYNPATPHPPLHPPSWSTLESAESKGGQELNLSKTPMDPSLILASVASGLWTAAPVLYLHCVNQSMLSLFPMLLLVAALEVAIMVMAHYQFEDSFAIVPSFVALRVSIRYLLWVPLNLPFEVVESLILFGSSSLALHTFAEPEEPTVQEEVQAQTEPNLPQENPRTKRKPPINFHRGVQW